jgi:hypothetical protein
MVCPFAYAELTAEYGGDVEIDWTFEQSSNGSDVLSISPGSASLFGVTIRNETEDGLYAKVTVNSIWSSAEMLELGMCIYKSEMRP